MKTRKVIRFYKSFSQTLIKIFLSYCDYTTIICPGVTIITLLYSSVCRQFLQAEPAGRNIPSNCIDHSEHQSAAAQKNIETDGLPSNCYHPNARFTPFDL